MQGDTTAYKRQPKLLLVCEALIVRKGERTGKKLGKKEAGERHGPKSRTTPRPALKPEQGKNCVK